MATEPLNGTIAASTRDFVKVRAFVQVNRKDDVHRGNGLARTITSVGSRDYEGEGVAAFVVQGRIELGRLFHCAYPFKVRGDRIGEVNLTHPDLAGKFIYGEVVVITGYGGIKVVGEGDARLSSFISTCTASPTMLPVSAFSVTVLSIGRAQRTTGASGHRRHPGDATLTAFFADVTHLTVQFVCIVLGQWPDPAPVVRSHWPISGSRHFPTLRILSALVDIYVNGSSSMTVAGNVSVGCRGTQVLSHHRLRNRRVNVRSEAPAMTSKVHRRSQPTASCGPLPLPGDDATPLSGSSTAAVTAVPNKRLGPWIESPCHSRGR